METGQTQSEVLEGKEGFEITPLIDEGWWAALILRGRPTAGVTDNNFICESYSQNWLDAGLMLYDVGFVEEFNIRKFRKYVAYPTAMDIQS